MYHEDIKKMYDKSRQSKKPAKRLLLIYLMLSDLFNVFIGYAAQDQDRCTLNK